MDRETLLGELSQKLNVPVNEFDFNTKFYRFAKHQSRPNTKPLWAVGTAFSAGKKDIYIVNCGDWSTGEQWTLKSYSDGEPMTSHMKNQINKAKEEVTQVVEEKKLLKQMEVAKKVQKKWDELRVEDHPYLDFKKIGHELGTRLDRSTLCVPIYYDKKLVNMQKIYFCTRTSRFQKRFTGGGKVSECYSFIGDVYNAKFMYVTEGFATAASIFMATKTPVLITFTANNIPKSIKHFRTINKNARMIIAADNDESCVGEKYAQEACGPNIDYILCPVESDYNDLHAQKGLKAVAEHLKSNKKPVEGIIMLGHDDADRYYYFNTEKQTMRSLTAAQHDYKHLVSIADKDYWAQTFKAYKKKADGTITNELDTTTLIDRVFHEQRSIGRIDMAKIKGYGVHLDNGEIAANLGDRLYYKGEEIPIYQSMGETNFFYQGNAPIKIDLNDQMTDKEGDEFLTTFQKLKWKSDYDFIVTAGWVAIAQIFGGLKWRPHLWVTGSRGSGKTTVLKLIDDIVFFSVKVENSTEAGIRQKLQGDARAVIIDEAESSDRDSKKSMKKILDHARSASSNTGSLTLRGTPGGKTIEMLLNGIFCMGSIQVPDLSGADQSRFFVVELDSKIDQPGWEKTERELDHFAHVLSPKIFSRMLVNFKQIQRNIDSTKQYLKNVKYLDQRMRDQIAPVIVGFHAFSKIEDITAAFIQEVLDRLEIERSDYVADNQFNEPEECFDAIMSTIIDGKENYSVYDHLKDYNAPNQRIMENYGIKVEPEGLAIHPKNDNLLAKLRETQFHSLGKLLPRHPGFIKKKSVRMAGMVRNCCVIDYRV